MFSFSCQEPLEMSVSGRNAHITGGNALYRRTNSLGSDRTLSSFNDRVPLSHWPTFSQSADSPLSYRLYTRTTFPKHNTKNIAYWCLFSRLILKDSQPKFDWFVPMNFLSKLCIWRSTHDLIVDAKNNH